MMPAISDETCIGECEECERAECLDERHRLHECFGCRELVAESEGIYCGRCEKWVCAACAPDEGFKYVFDETGRGGHVCGSCRRWR